MKPYYTVTELGPGVYRLYSDEGVHCDLFDGEKKALLWDTGYGFGDLYGTVRKITDKPLILVNSHAHMDHASGNFQFQESVYLHPKDWELYRKKTTPAERKRYVEDARHTPDFQHDTGFLNILPEDFNEEKYINGKNENLIPVREGDCFDLGGIHLTAVETPGHTQGSISLIYEEKKWLYAGDAMNNFMFLFLEESAPLSVYIQTLKKAKALNMERLIISHYVALLEIEILDTFLDCALHLDFDQGLPFKGAVGKGLDARICCKGKPSGFYSKDPKDPMIVIRKEKIDM